MIVKKIIQIGNPIIHRKSKKVSDINLKEIKATIKNLIDSLRYHQLIGMAAPQIGTNVRIFVIEIRQTGLRKNIKVKHDLQIYINPQIIWSSKEVSEAYEGCGSVAFANIFGPVKRAKMIKVQAHNEKGEMFTQDAAGILARVIQHEYDHLDGITFIEKVSNARKLMSRGEYTKNSQ